MEHADLVYGDLLKRILEEGEEKEDRTGTGTLSLFGPQVEFDLAEGFPLLTRKKVPFRLVAEELFWFLNGDTDLKTMLDKNVNIWTDDGYRYYLERAKADEHRYIHTKEEFIEKAKMHGFPMGSIYGKNWRSWNLPASLSNSENEGVVDQVANVIDSIRNNPHSRRHIVSAWNAGEVEHAALPPCHTMFQFYVGKDNTLSCKMYQRSADVFLGVPFNIASYALLTHLIAKMTGLKPGKFIHTFGDAHIYNNHIEAVKTLLDREPKPLPQLEVLTVKDKIEEYTMDDLKLSDYNPHPSIKADLSVGL